VDARSIVRRSVSRRPLTFSDVDYADIQGLVRFGHSHLEDARFFLLRIKDVQAARSWLAARLPPARRPPAYGPHDAEPDPTWVTTAVKDRLPGTALQVALTYPGLKALGVPDKILDEFSIEFRSGMTERSRSRRLGDVDANAPEYWDWGTGDKVPHVLVMLYARKNEVAAFEAKVLDGAWDKAFSQLPSLSTNDIGDIEPFGFVDGASQPVIDWERQPRRLRSSRDYTNTAAVGEFLLGYPNEYCRYTDRPLLDPGDDPGKILSLAEDAPGKRDLGRNGTYLVLRDLAQDVVHFWQFLDAQARRDPHMRERLANAMVGRMRADDAPVAGSPVMPLRDEAIAGVAWQTDEKRRMEDLWRNRFTFDKDPDATACPFGAHIRRANPRNADLPAGTRGPIAKLLRTLGFDSKGPHDDVLASTRFHRILRRGREYGPRLTPEDAILGKERDQKRGLRFICLNANISRQFEFVQAAWIVNPKFSGTDEGDPLLGNRKPLGTGRPTNGFTQPQDGGLPCRTSGLSQFVTVRGGAYFFLPGIAALRYLATGPGASVS
jgi:deferrochelatase/peroxidase EfeB